jgi:hypothetical protein
MVFLVSVAVFLSMQEQQLQRAENAYAQEIAYQFADYIETAFIAGPGFSQEVSMPADIHGKPYVITVSRALTGAGSTETGFVYLDWRGPVRESSFSAPTITASYGYSESSGFIYSNSAGGIVINASLGLPVKIENTGGSIRFSRG